MQHEDIAVSRYEVIKEINMSRTPREAIRKISGLSSVYDPSLWEAFETFVNAIYHEDTFDSLTDHLELKTFTDIFKMYTPESFVSKMKEFKEGYDGRDEG